MKEAVARGDSDTQVRKPRKAMLEGLMLTHWRRSHHGKGLLGIELKVARVELHREAALPLAGVRRWSTNISVEWECRGSTGDDIKVEERGGNGASGGSK